MRKSEQAINRRVVAIFYFLLVALVGFWAGYIVKLLRSPQIPSPAANNALLLAQFVDVGDGDAAIFSSPAGLLLLIDAGSDADGARAVLAQLQRIHRSAPKVILLTCSRQRSIGGVAYLLANCPFHGTVVLPSSAQEFARTGGLAARDILAAAQRRRLRVVSWEQFDGELADPALLSDANIAATPIPVAALTDEGDNALAVRLDLRNGYGTGSLFYAAGLSGAEEDALLDQRAHLTCDILAATNGAHDESLSSEFLAQTGPENVCMSTSATNPPDPAVLERCRAADATVERTDQLETVTLGLTGQPGAQVVYYAPGAPLPLAIIAPQESHSSRIRPS